METRFCLSNIIDRMQRGGAGQGGWSSVDADPKAPMDTFLVIFSRTELIIGASRAKNCEEVDGEVRLPVQRPKIGLQRRKTISETEKSRRQNFLLAEN